jgi:threonine dehydratase
LLRAAEIIRSSAGRAFFASANSEIADAMRLYYTDTHNVTEGAGAAPLAGLIRERQLVRATRRRNMQWQQHRRAGLCRDPRRPHAGRVMRQ